jgi:hypothetical protein
MLSVLPDDGRNHQSPPVLQNHLAVAPQEEAYIQTGVSRPERSYSFADLFFINPRHGHGNCHQYIFYVVHATNGKSRHPSILSPGIVNRQTDNRRFDLNIRGIDVSCIVLQAVGLIFLRSLISRVRFKPNLLISKPSGLTLLPKPMKASCIISSFHKYPGDPDPWKK